MPETTPSWPIKLADVFNAHSLWLLQFGLTPVFLAHQKGKAGFPTFILLIRNGALFDAAPGHVAPVAKRKPKEGEEGAEGETKEGDEKKAEGDEKPAEGDSKDGEQKADDKQEEKK